MIDRRALPAVVVGVAGFIAALAGLLEAQAWFGLVAGTCALLAGFFAFELADRLRRTTDAYGTLAKQSATQKDASDLMAARAARFEAEALKTRAQVAEAIRHEAVYQGAGADRADAVSPSVVDPVNDPVTGLFTERFFLATLEKRVSAARRGLRPLGLVLLEVVTDISSGRPQPCDPRVVAEALVDTLREADTIARFENGRFALLLEDTPENGSIWTIERLRRRLGDSHPGHTVWAGLSCYPTHAFEQTHLLAQARSALIAAKQWRQDRIEVAVVPED